jgi:biotin-(acetyl-CoA carboxylase) ligase
MTKDKIASFVAFVIDDAVRKIQYENEEMEYKKEELEQQLIQSFRKILEQPTRKQVIMILETRRKYLKRRVTSKLLPEIEGLREDHSKIYNREQRNKLIYETNQLNNEIAALEKLLNFYCDPGYHWIEIEEDE